MISSDTTGDERYQNFYSVLKKKLEVYRDSKQHLDRFLSTDFNVFKWIEPENKDLQPDQISRFEKRRSAIIADLLKPSGSHGQQRKFLDAFLRRIEKDDLCDKQLRQVATEYRIENPEGYIDVLVDFRAFAIAIENKPWAKEGHKQLDKYIKYLNKEYNDQFCLVYLTLSGDKPVSIESDDREPLMKQGKLLLLSYNPDILKWLEECCRLCESDKFRWFLRDFMDHLNGGQTMASQKEQEIILAHALEEKNLKTALDIGFAFNVDGGELHKRIIVGFLDKLEGFVLKERGDRQWHVKHDGLRLSPLTNDSHFSFGKKSWGERYEVGLQRHKPGAFIGVWRETETLSIDGLKKTLDDKLKLRGNVDKYGWNYYLKDPYRNWNTTEALIKLHNGEAVEYIGTKLVKIIKEVEPIIDKQVKNIGKKRS